MRGKEKRGKSEKDVTFPLFLFANVLPNADLCTSRGGELRLYPHQPLQQAIAENGYEYQPELDDK